MKVQVFFSLCKTFKLHIGKNTMTQCSVDIMMGKMATLFSILRMIKKLAKPQ